jgi:predicted nucleotidyltransferase
MLRALANSLGTLRVEGDNVDEQWIPARLRESLAALVAACEDDPAVLAAWVGGSLARDTADDWSDIDLHLLVAHPEEFGSGITEWVAATMPLVLADEIPGVPGGFIFVTPDWVHVDVIVHGSQVFSQAEFPARVLFDTDGRVRDIPASVEQMVGEPYFPRDQIKLYLYFMGVTVTVIHRREWLALAQGAAGFRDSLLIPLMLAENGVRKIDGAKRLNRYLTAEQIAALQAIPPIGSDPEQLINAHTVIAREYLTRGRRLAGVLDETWPTALEQASLALWRHELGINLE